MSTEAQPQPFKIQPFAWGKVVDKHEIGVSPGGVSTYIIVEYKPYKNGSSPRRVDDTAPHMFHVYVDEKDCNVSTLTLEGALVYAIAHKSLGPHPEGMSMLYRALKLDEAM